MNDSIQNLHKTIKKEVNVEIGRENLIKCRCPKILTAMRYEVFYRYKNVKSEYVRQE